jgi:hypothetical protein
MELWHSHKIRGIGLSVEVWCQRYLGAAEFKTGAPLFARHENRLDWFQKVEDHVSATLLRGCLIVS